MTAEMDSEHSERIVLAVTTNLNTRFVVLPLRSETVGDIRGTIKSYHMNLFPTWGDVDVNALEVELFGGRSRVADPIPIGHLFWKASQAAVFAELIPSTSNAPLIPRLELGGAPGLNIASARELRQHPDEKTPSPPKKRGGLVEGQVIPDTGASSLGKLGKSVTDYKIVEGRQLRTKKRGIDERESANVVGERQIAAEFPAVDDVVEPAAKKTNIDRGHPVLEHNNEPETEVVLPDKLAAAKSVLLVTESRLKSNSADGPASCQQPTALLAKKVQEFTSSPSKPTEKDAVVKRARALDFTLESIKRDGSGSGSQSDLPLAEKLRAEPGLANPKPIEDSVTKTLNALETKHNSSSSETSDSSSRSGHPGIKVQEEPGLETSKPDEKGIERNSLALDASPGSSSSQSGTQTGSQKGTTRRKQDDTVEEVSLATPERRVPSGGHQNVNVSSTRSSLEIKNRGRHSQSHESDPSSGSSSGGSTDESSGQNENSGEKRAEVQGKDNNSSTTDGNSTESDAEEGSKSDRPRESSVGKDSDQTTSDGDSSLQSSEGSESENIESSSDESDGSEDMPPTGRSTDFSTPKAPKDGGGAAKSIGRRSFGGVVDPKYRHLLESQDGFDELINLSQQNLKVTSGSQHELQPPAEPHDSLAPVSLADDSLSIDLVPDTQVGDLDENCGIPDVRKDHLTVVEPVENNANETQPLTQESVIVGRPVIDKEEMPAEPVQDGAEDGESLQCMSGPPTSVKLGEGCLLLSVKEELISTGGGGITEAVLEKPGEEPPPPPQARSEDSQQIRAALQLTRMSVGKGVDPDLAVGKKRIKKKRGNSSLAEAVTETRSKELEEESSHHKDSSIRDPSVVSHHEGDDDDQKLEASKEVIIKPGSTTADGSQSGAHFAEEVASDAVDVGRKKHRKKSNKIIEESNTAVPPQEDIRGEMNKTVEDTPSRGGLDRPDNSSDEAAAKKENSLKSPLSLFEYRDLRKRSSSLVAVNPTAPVERKRLVLKRDKLPNSLNRKDGPGAEEDQQPDRLIGETDEPVCPGPENNTHSSAPNNKKKSLHEEHRVLGNGQSPNEPIQTAVVEAQSPSSHVGKKKKKDRKEESLVENRSTLHMEVNQNDAGRSAKTQVADTEPPNLGFEDLSGLLRRESIDKEIEEEGLPATGPNKEFGGQQNAKGQLNGEPPARKKQGGRKLSVEFSENSSRLKQSSTGNKKDRSASLPEDRDFVPDKSLQVPDSEEEKEKEGDEDRPVLDEGHSNRDEDNVAEKEHPLVPDVQKKGSKRIVQSSKSSKKARNLETITSLMTNQNARKTQKAAENGNVPLGSVNVETADAQPRQLHRELIENVVGKHPTGSVSALHEEQRATLSTDGAETVPSSPVEKTKRKRDKSKIPKKQSKPEVAEEEETEQLENPAALGTEEEDEQPIDGSRTERQDPDEKSLNTKRKKAKHVTLDPSIDDRKSEGEETEAGQVELVDHEDQITTEMPLVKNLNLKGRKGNTPKKRVRRRKVVEEISLSEESEEERVSLQKKKVSRSKNSATGNLAKRQQIMPSSGKKRVNSKPKPEKNTEGRTRHPS